MEDITKSQTKLTNSTNWIKKFNVPLYGSRVWITVGDEIESVCKEFKIMPGDDLSRYAAGCFRDNCGRFVLLYLRANLTHAVIAHEVTHAAFRIAQYHGWGHNEATVEPFASLAEFISYQVYKALDSHGEKIKHSKSSILV